jgi:hypothetical protein
MSVFRIVMGKNKTQSAKRALPAANEAAWFTATQLADRWLVNVMTVRRYFYEGRLKGRTFSRGVIRFSAKDVADFEAQG